MFNKTLPNGITPHDVVLWLDGSDSAFADKKTGTTYTATAVTRGDQIHGGTEMIFDGSTSKIECGALGNVKTVVGWVKPTKASVDSAGYLIDLDGTSTVTYTVRQLAATSFTDPTIYVNGASGNGLKHGSWSFFAVTTATAINAADCVIGCVGANFFNGSMTNLIFFNKTLTANEISQIYNNNSKDTIRGGTGSVLTTVGTVVDLNSLTYTTTGGVATKNDTTYTSKSGNAMFKMSNTAGSWHYSKAAFVRDMSGDTLVSFWLYMPNWATAVSTSFYMQFSSDVNFSKYKQCLVDALDVAGRPSAGWTFVHLRITDFTDSGTENWATIAYLRFFFTGLAGQSAIFCVDQMQINRMNRPKVVISFDDMNDSVYTLAYPYMVSKGLVGTMFCSYGLIGSVNVMTIPQLTELFNAGWSLGNHTKSHNQAGWLAYSYAQQYAEIKDNQTWLDGMGWGKDNGNKILVTPGNLYDANTIQASIDSGNLVFLRSSGTGARDAYQYNEDDDWPYVRRTSTIVWSAIKTQAEILTDAKALTSKIDNCVTMGSCLIFNFHHINSGDCTEGNDFPYEGFTWLMDYLATRDGDTLDVVNAIEWQNSL